MKLIVDENITCGKEAFSKFGKVYLHPGREISKEIVKDADALIVRSITNVNEELLKNSNVKFVGTATIGFDHIDTNYLASQKIGFTTAAGCNSYAVAEYVMSSLAYLIKNNNFSLKGKSIGIVGHGNIGKIVEQYSKALGLKIVLNDPPLKRETGESKYKSLEKALGCDIITLHVPLNKDGIDKTVHLINEKNLSLMKSGSVLINSCRGPVVDNQILKNRLSEKKDLLTVFDVWENEPFANLEFLQLTNISTTHIAGYSYEGRINGTKIIFNKLNSFLKTEYKWQPPSPKLENPELKINSFSADQFLTEVFNQTYQVEKDSNQLKKIKSGSPESFAKTFDLIRKNYPFRRELLNYYVCSSAEGENSDLLKSFRIKQTPGE